MTYKTHALLADLLYPVLCETWQVRLSRKRLVWGSVKPDCSALFVTHPHFWKLSKRYIKKQITRLCRSTRDAAKKNRDFSEKLGVVLHYIADFFTSVHNLPSITLRSHIAFEDRLYEMFVQYVTPQTIETSLKLVLSSRSIIQGDPVELLKELHGRYDPVSAEPISDVRDILVATLAITAGIMDRVFPGRRTLNTIIPYGVKIEDASGGERAFVTSAG